jgi:multidrug efflux system membrane fusion protein
MKHGAALILGLAILSLSACGKKAAPVTTPPPVSFATAVAQDTPLTVDTFGNCMTIADVTLQAQVTGTLLRYAIDQGAMVKKGQLVAEIDPAPFQAALEEAQGNLDSARAQLANAQVTLQRQQELYKTKTIDLADLQNAEASQLQNQGAVLTAEGQVKDAQVNLAYCTIYSPIDGKAGIYEMDAGNLVSANTSKLINIQTLDPIYVNFTISENDFPTVKQYFDKGGLDVIVHIPGLPDEKVQGKLTFIDNAISSTTGTLNLQATFSNAKQLLWPGLYVDVELVLTVLKDAVVVPSPCVMYGQKGPYVFVVNADNTVTQQQIVRGERRGDLTVITSGLAAGARVITAGQLGLDTGMKVTPSAYVPPPVVKADIVAPTPTPVPEKAAP